MEQREGGRRMVRGMVQGEEWRADAQGGTE